LPEPLLKNVTRPKPRPGDAKCAVFDDKRNVTRAVQVQHSVSFGSFTLRFPDLAGKQPRNSG